MEIEKRLALLTCQQVWIEHLEHIEWLRTSTSFRGYGQRDPKMEFKREAYAAFKILINNLYSKIVSNINDLYYKMKPTK